MRRLTTPKLLTWTAGAALALVATSASAQRRCELPRELTGRTCDTLLCIALQDEVDAICKPKPARCQPGEGCFNLRQKKRKFLDCYAARNRINVVCWGNAGPGGGNPGHQAEAAEMITRASECDAIIAMPEPEGCADPCPLDFARTAAPPAPEALESREEEAGEAPPADPEADLEADDES